MSFSSQRSSGREDAALHTVSTRRGLCAELLVIGEAVSRAKAAPSLNHRNASGGGATREPSLLACARRSVCGVPADRSGSLSDLGIQRIPYATHGLNLFSSVDPFANWCKLSRDKGLRPKGRITQWVR